MLAQKKQTNATTKDGRFFCPYLFLSSLVPKDMTDRLENDFVLRPLPPFDRLAAPVAAHPDMLIFKSGERLILHSDYYSRNRRLFEDLEGRIILSDEHISAQYPHDVLFNALLMGDTLFARCESISRIILERHRTSVNVKQGYAACSCAKVSGNALITADRGIAAAANEKGLSVLLIRPGHIALEGYSYGFIGGACFSWNDCVYFFGDMDSHPDSQIIREFIAQNGKRTVILGGNHPLSDFGGAAVAVI